MSITDELREFYQRADGYELWCPRHRRELAEIADRIDAEHERAVSEQPYTIDMVPMTDENMAEHGLVKLPTPEQAVEATLGAVHRKTHTTEYCDRCEGAVLPKWKKCPWCGEPLEEV